MDSTSRAAPSGVVLESIPHLASAVRELYFNCGSAQQASAALEHFQHQPLSTWRLCIKVLVLSATDTVCLQNLCFPSGDAQLNAQYKVVAEDFLPFFAARTLCAHAQSGVPYISGSSAFAPEGGNLQFCAAELNAAASLIATDHIQQGSTAATTTSINQLFAELIHVCKLSGGLHFIVQRQLAAAVSALILCAPHNFMSNLQMLKATLGTDARTRRLILEVYEHIPADLSNKQIAFPTDVREFTTVSVLRQTEAVLTDLGALLQNIDQQDSGMRQICFQAFSTWCAAVALTMRKVFSSFDPNRFSQGAPHKLLGVVRGTGASVRHYKLHASAAENDHMEGAYHSLFTSLPQLDIFRNAMWALSDCTQHLVQSCCADACAEILQLADSVDSQTWPTTTIILEGLEAFAVSLRTMRDAALASDPSSPCHGWSAVPNVAARSYCLLLGRAAVWVLPAIVNISEQQGGVLVTDTAATTMVRPHFAKVKVLMGLAVGLLHHPQLEVKKLVMDCWHALLGEPVESAVARCEGGVAKPLPLQERACLTSVVDLLVDQLVVAVQYPEEVFLDAVSTTTERDLVECLEQPSDFDFDDFRVFREQCASSLTDSTLLVGPETLIEQTGSELQRIASDTSTRHMTPKDWVLLEACIWLLTSVSPRAKAGGDQFVTSALLLVPKFCYPRAIYSGTILRSTVARLTSWTANFVGSRMDIVSVVHPMIIGFINDVVAINSVAQRAEVKSNVDSSFILFLWHSEWTCVDALCSVTTSAVEHTLFNEFNASKDLTSNSAVNNTERNNGQSSVRQTVQLLGNLSDLVLRPQIDGNNRCLLVETAGHILSLLPNAQMKPLYVMLVSNLEQRLTSTIAQRCSNLSGTSSTPLTETSSQGADSEDVLIKLFFAAVQCVTPNEHIPPPPSSANPLSSRASPVFIPRGALDRHPNLEALEHFWSITEGCLTRLDESGRNVDYACQCAVTIFSRCKLHAPSYEVFYAFLRDLAKSHRLCPSVFTLNALRSMLGIFGNNKESFVIQALVDCLQAAMEVLTEKLQLDGLKLITANPDLVGMTLDCGNACLSNSASTCGLLKSQWFRQLFEICLTLTPSCEHPKVLLTMLLLPKNFVAWLDCATPSRDLPAAEQHVILSEAITVAEQLSRPHHDPRGGGSNWVCKIVECMMAVLATNTLGQDFSVVEAVALTVGVVLGSQKWCQLAAQAIRQALEKLPRESLLAEERLRVYNELVGADPSRPLASNWTSREACVYFKKLSELFNTRWKCSKFEQSK